MFNWVDLVVLIILLRAAWVGFRRGAVGELIFSGGVIFLSFVLIRYYNPISKILNSYLNISSKYSGAIAYSVVVIIGFFLIWLISRIITFVINVGVFERINRFFGIIFGIIRGGVVCSIFLHFLVLLNIKFLTDLIVQDSFCGKFLANIPLQIYSYIKNIFV